MTVTFKTRLGELSCVPKNGAEGFAIQWDGKLIASVQPFDNAMQVAVWTASREYPDMLAEVQPEEVIG